jgi:hypothetical protein
LTTTFSPFAHRLPRQVVRVSGDPLVELVVALHPRVVAVDVFACEPEQLGVACSL